MRLDFEALCEYGIGLDRLQEYYRTSLDTFLQNIEMPQSHQRNDTKGHSLPIAEMGNFELKMKYREYLRPLDVEEEKFLQEFYLSFKPPYPKRRLKQTKLMTCSPQSFLEFSKPVDFTAIDGILSDPDLNGTYTEPICSDQKLNEDAAGLTQHSLARAMECIRTPGRESRLLFNSILGIAQITDAQIERIYTDICRFGRHDLQISCINKK